MTLLFSNRSYQILKGELANVGAANAGRKALDMMDLGNPDIDWVKMAGSLGVAGSRATSMEELAVAFQAGLDENGPYLVEIVL
jgi:acetolactate synthase-1/2/3 large subunit